MLLCLSGEGGVVSRPAVTVCLEQAFRCQDKMGAELVKSTRKCSENVNFVLVLCH